MPQEPLPTERDFSPTIGNLDSQSAWRTFGGLTLEQARAKFLENPGCYQEHFMFMGWKAFAYYFPIVEEYLTSVPEGFNEHDHEAWILSCCIKMQFECNDISQVHHLIPRVIALADFVQRHIDRFGEDEAERKSVAEGWSDLVRHVNSIATRA